MSLDLLKKKFGHSVSTDKKETDKQKLNEMFISKPAGDINLLKPNIKMSWQKKIELLKI